MSTIVCPALFSWSTSPYTCRTYDVVAQLAMSRRERLEVDSLSSRSCPARLANRLHVSPEPHAPTHRVAHLSRPLARGRTSSRWPQSAACSCLLSRIPRSCALSSTTSKRSLDRRPLTAQAMARPAAPTGGAPGDEPLERAIDEALLGAAGHDESVVRGGDQGA